MDVKYYLNHPRHGKSFCILVSNNPDTSIAYGVTGNLFKADV
jgi:hypothetical protein